MRRSVSPGSTRPRPSSQKCNNGVVPAKAGPNLPGMAANSREMLDPPLRHLRFWQAIGFALIAFVIYESLTPHPVEVPLEQGDKYGHVLAYATLMAWFAQIYL